MFDTNLPSQQRLNLAQYRDKVLGCWTGKNIGGTLGFPFEGKKEMNEVTFYAQDLQGNPAPNDDLDLQLVWLQAVEERGLYNLTPRLLGEYWMTCIVGPWNEYSVCKANIANGLYPPLSGSCNNDVWKYSNGAWIRSEIWACLFPGSPDEAAEFAYMDSCCDHCGEGIYAEIFTVTLQSAAFVESDVRKLIEIALSKIPHDCRVAQNVRMACSLYDNRTEFKQAREAIVQANADLGWFQAPGNIAFAILGLLYGEGDFGKSICLANNCGDDTDCTAATIGALLGIIYGRSKLPQKWIDPIGESIKTVAIDGFTMDVPKTVIELTDRVVRQALIAQRSNPTLPLISDEPTRLSTDFLAALHGSTAVAKRVWTKSPYALVFDLPYAQLSVDYENGPSLLAGEEKTIHIRLNELLFREQVVHVSLELPEGWQVHPARTLSINCLRGFTCKGTFNIIAGPMTEAFTYIPMTVRLAGRFNPITLQVPFQLKGAACHWPDQINDVHQPYWDEKNRRAARCH